MTRIKYQCSCGYAWYSSKEHPKCPRRGRSPVRKYLELVMSIDEELLDLSWCEFTRVIKRVINEIHKVTAESMEKGKP